MFQQRITNRLIVKLREWSRWDQKMFVIAVSWQLFDNQPCCQATHSFSVLLEGLCKISLEVYRVFRFQKSDNLLWSSWLKIHCCGMFASYFRLLSEGKISISGIVTWPIFNFIDSLNIVGDFFSNPSLMLRNNQRDGSSIYATPGKTRNCIQLLKNYLWENSMKKLSSSLRCLFNC